MKNSSNRNHVFICRSNPATHDPRVEKTAQTLKRHGMDVTILCWEREHNTDSVSFDGDIGFIRLGIPARYGSGMRNLVPLLRWQYRLFRRLFRERDRYQLIHACDFDTLLPSLLLKLLGQKKVIYDIFDFYSDNLRHTPVLFKSILQKIDLFLIGHCDCIILADDSRRSQIAAAHAKQIAVINNTPEDILDILEQELNILPHDNFRLAYVGQIIHGRGLLEISTMIAKHPSWQLDVAGFGADENAILDRIQSIPNIHWHGKLHYRQALALNYRADALFAIYDPSIPNHRHASPNKVFEAMMLKKPVIVAKNTGVDQMIDAEQIGMVVEYGNADQLERVLVELSNSPEKCEEIGRRSRKLYETKYSWETMENRLIELYRQVSL